MTTWYRNDEVKEFVRRRLNRGEYRITGGILLTFAVMLFMMFSGDLDTALFVFALYAFVMVIYIVICVLQARSERGRYLQYVANGDILELGGQAKAFSSLAEELIEAEAERKREWLHAKLAELEKARQTKDVDSIVIAAMVQAFIAELNSMAYGPGAAPSDQPQPQ